MCYVSETLYQKKFCSLKHDLYELRNNQHTSYLVNIETLCVVYYGGTKLEIAAFPSKQNK